MVFNQPSQNCVFSDRFWLSLFLINPAKTMFFQISFGWIDFFRQIKSVLLEENQIVMDQLVGRTDEKKILTNALNSGRAELIAIYGRRRVGKTFLVRSAFAKEMTFEFSGVHNALMQEQLENFSYALKSTTKSSLDLVPPKNWQEAFRQLENVLTPMVKKRRMVVFFDEFPWMSSPRSGFLKAFDYFWNTWGTKQGNLTLVICGSAASWMIENIVNNRGGLHNRITVRIRLSPFTLKETQAYFESKAIELNRYQILQLYMTMGGIPHYLSKVQRGESATQAIDRICFSQNGFLKGEFDNLFVSLFRQSEHHLGVVKALAVKARGLTRSDLIAKVSISSGGTATQVIKELEESGFIGSYVPFGKNVKDLVWRLTDEFTFFYLRFMAGKKAIGTGTWKRLSKMPSWISWSGLAFEGICLKHVDQIKRALGINDIYVEQSMWSLVGTQKIRGAQIDMLLDRDDHCMNICEMKFSTEEFSITKRYAEELQNKKSVLIDVLKVKKAVFLTMITTYGVSRNDYYRKQVHSEITMQDLFD